MDPINATMLLSSIDHTLASVRAAVAAGEDPQQSQEARTRLAGLAGADIARLAATSGRGDWTDAPPEVSAAIARAADAASRGDLRQAEAELTTGRERLGGPSR